MTSNLRVDGNAKTCNGINTVRAYRCDMLATTTALTASTAIAATAPSAAVQRDMRRINLSYCVRIRTARSEDESPWAILTLSI